MKFKFSEKTFRTVFSSVFYQVDRNIISNFSKTSDNYLMVAPAENFLMVTRNLDEDIPGELREDWLSFHSHLDDLCIEAKKMMKIFLY